MTIYDPLKKIIRDMIKDEKSDMRKIENERLASYNLCLGAVDALSQLMVEIQILEEKIKKK